MRSSLKSHLALLTVALIYGANFTIAKEVLVSGYIQPHGFILFRVLTGVLLFGAAYFIFVREKVAREDWGLFVICALFGIAVNQLLLFRGLKLTGPIHASLIMTTTPILVLLTSAILVGERITAQKVLGIIIGALGAILLIAYGQELTFRSEQLLGDVQVFINALSYGIYLVLAKSLIRKYHLFTVMFWLFLLGFCFVFPFGIQEALAVEWSRFSPGIWVGFAYVLLFTTFLAYLLNNYALTNLTASIVSIYIYLQPLFASAIALFFGRDEGTVLKLLAAVLIFTGVYLVSRPQKGDFEQK